MIRLPHLKLAALIALVGASIPATANAEEPGLIPPVDAAVARGFALPAGQRGPGNRGIDYEVVSGTPVRAAAGGTVTFAGRVPNTVAVTVDHGDGFETTYTGMRALYVARGDVIDQGHWLGETDDRFHFGVLKGEVYVDPQAYLRPIDSGDAIHLIPVERTEGLAHVVREAFERSIGREFEGRETIGCTSRSLLESAGHQGPPNDNIVVAIGGIGDAWRRSESGRIAALAPRLGYAGDRSFVLSYSDDPDGYERSDTFGDLRVAAGRLDRLLQRIAIEFPGTDVDLLAHSQGGLVARYYLETAGARPDGRRPHVEHVVTFSSPHQGAPLASVTKAVGETWSGKLALDGLQRAHQGRDPFPIPGLFKFVSPVVPVADATLSFATRAASKVAPDPYARSVQQMRPGSEFLTNLATDDVAFGTQVLALQDRFDVVVPADHARWPGEVNRAADGHPDKLLGGLNRHGDILVNPEPVGMAHSFLRGASLPCAGAGDRDAWDWGRRISTGTKLLPHVWRIGEDAVLSVALKGKATSVKAVVREGSTVWRLLRARGLRGVADYGRGKVTYVIRNPTEVLEWLADERIESELQDAVSELLKVVTEAGE